MNKRKLTGLLLIAGIISAGIYGTKLYIKRKVEEKSFVLYPEDQAKISLAENEHIQRIRFDSEGNTLYAKWSLNSESSPSIFILHGNGETLGDWVEPQVVLRESGYNSFVFDYSGFGSSEGVPTVETLDEDAKNAWTKFCELSNASNARIAVGHSLGSAVLLSSVNTYASAPDKLIIHAAYSSARAIAIYYGTADRSWAWILPDVWNNTENIQVLPTTNICIVHSKSDVIIPYEMGLQVSAQNNDAHLLLLDGYLHNTLYESPSADFWNKILNCGKH